MITIWPRRPDGTIDLVEAFELVSDHGLQESAIDRRIEQAQNFLMHIEQIQPINSRQAAAVALAQAFRIYRGVL